MCVLFAIVMKYKYRSKWTFDIKKFFSAVPFINLNVILPKLYRSVFQRSLHCSCFSSSKMAHNGVCQDLFCSLVTTYNE